MFFVCKHNSFNSLGSSEKLESGLLYNDLLKVKCFSIKQAPNEEAIKGTVLFVEWSDKPTKTLYCFFNSSIQLKFISSTGVG